MNHSLDSIRRQTRSVYQNRARTFDGERSRSMMEKPWLDRFLAGLPRGGTILDLGCGSGEPIAAALIQQGFSIVGVDYASNMIELARQRFPKQTWLVKDMRQPVDSGPFDGVLSWNGFFHLTPEEQIETLPKLANSVKAGGNLMLTTGHHHGEVTGKVAGEEVYHASLDPEHYRQLLAQAGFGDIHFTPQDPECGYHSILLARDRQY